MQPQVSSSAASAFKIHAILLYLGAAAIVVVGVFLFFFNQSIIESRYYRGSPSSVPAYIIGGTLAGAFVAMIVWGMFNWAAGNWSARGTHRTGAYVVAVLNLFGFPVGTVLGIWALVALGKSR